MKPTDVEADAAHVRAVHAVLAGPQTVYVVHAHDVDGDRLDVFSQLSAAREWLRHLVLEAHDEEWAGDEVYARLRDEINARLTRDPDTYAGIHHGANWRVIVHALPVL